MYPLGACVAYVPISKIRVAADDHNGRYARHVTGTTREEESQPQRYDKPRHKAARSDSELKIPNATNLHSGLSIYHCKVAVAVHGLQVVVPIFEILRHCVAKCFDLPQTKRCRRSFAYLRNIFTQRTNIRAKQTNSTPGTRHDTTRRSACQSLGRAGGRTATTGLSARRAKTTNGLTDDLATVRF